MKKGKILLFTLLAGMLGFSAAYEVGRNIKYSDDNAIYDTPVIRDINHPDFIRAGDDEIPDVKVVELHYHNDNGGCGRDTTTPGTAGGRAFYIWTTGVGGVECMPDHVANDGQDMDITIDLTSEKFSKYAGKTALLFIIKFRMNSASDENWGGQSSDTELSYFEFPPDENGKVVAWTTTGSGSDIAVFHTEAETKVLGVKAAEFVDWKTIKCTNTAESVRWEMYAYDETFFKRDAKTRDQFKKYYLIMNGTNSGESFNITFPKMAHINMVYCIESHDLNSTTGLSKSCYVTFDKLYSDPRFLQYYVYDGDDLGCTVTDNSTTFKVWAPTAANMTLLVYGTGLSLDFGGSNKSTGYHMFYQPGGIWTITFNKKLSGSYYTYQVSNSGGTQESMDPYAKACGLNGVRGYVYTAAFTNPEGWDELPAVWDGNTTFKWDASNAKEVSGLDITTPQELSIYEVHVQDFTGDESWNGTESKRGTYEGFVERGTHVEGHEDVSTGYDHLNELGVRAVQLLPIFDHDNDETDKENYNWGYNPLNYNCVEGAYSSDPTSPMKRIRELKNLVLQMSKTDNHTRVIMDVVYNHVSRASASSFTKLMPKYYFRYSRSGEYTNGSGCSNEVKSENYMVRKFIVDSVMYWAKEYKIKGFRFDLMGLIDTETMRAVKDSLYKYDKDIYVYGEGWTGGGYGEMEEVSPGNWQTVPETVNNTVGTTSDKVYSMLYPSSTSPGYLGGFNDSGRNALRGGNDQGWGSSSHLPGWGFMQKGDDASSGDRGAVADMLWGIATGKGGNPKQTVNYASCHDNWTVFDQLYYTLGDSGNGVAPDYKYVMDGSVTAHALIFASNGAAFMLGGEEIFRTKELDDSAREKVSPNTYEKMYSRYCSHNSYNSPLSVNSFKWNNKITAHGVSYAGYFDAFKKMVKLHHDMDKFPYESSGFPYHQTSAGNPIDNISWAGGGKNGTYEGAAGFQLDEYFIFAAGRCWGYVGSDAHTWTKLYDFGTWKHGDYGNSVDVGDYATNKGCAIVIFRRG